MPKKSPQPQREIILRCLVNKLNLLGKQFAKIGLLRGFGLFTQTDILKKFTQKGHDIILITI